MNTSRLNNMLLYPEPEMSGGGAAPAPEISDPQENTPPETGEASEPANEDKNPFDFTKFGGKDESDAPTADEHEENDYSLTFSDAFTGNDSDRAMITKHAQACGLSAEVASDFVNKVYSDLQAAQRESDANELASLQNLWGADFDKNMGATGQLIHDVCKEMGMAPEMMKAYMRPEAFLLVNHIRQKLGESRAVGTGGAAKKAAAEDAMRILSDPTSEESTILANPNHKQYREMADKMNEMFGERIF